MHDLLDNFLATSERARVRNPPANPSRVTTLTHRNRGGGTTVIKSRWGEFSQLLDEITPGHNSYANNLFMSPRALLADSGQFVLRGTFPLRFL